MDYFWPDTNIRGVALLYIVKHSPGNTDSKYKWVYGFNYLGPSVFLEVPILTFLALHTKRKRCGQVGLTPCYLQSSWVYMPSFRPVTTFVLLFFFGKRTILFLVQKGV